MAKPLAKPECGENPECMQRKIQREMQRILKRKLQSTSSGKTALKHQTTPLEYYLSIGNTGHTRNTYSWKKPDIYKNTYFIMPPVSESRENIHGSIFEGFAEVDIRDFVKFWHELADHHKERRLMVNYFCAIRGIEEMYDKLEQGDMSILRELISEYTWRYRDFLIKGQHQSEFQDNISSWIKVNMPMPNQPADNRMWDYFANPYCTAISAWEKKGESDKIGIATKITRQYLGSVIGGLVSLYTDWASFDLAKVVSYAENQRVLHHKFALRTMEAGFCKAEIMTNPEFAVPKEEDRKRFMSKVAAQVPHWNKTDRAKILGMIENPGTPHSIDFMRRLIDEVGMEKFKILALGKEYFCACCNRSSYIGDDRLWACPQCHWECTRPRARYCNENCQKADWIKHKSEFHSVDVCNTCKKKAEEPGKKLRRCGRCIKENIPKPAHYCDEICQKQDWPKHKEAKHSKKGA